MDKPYSIREVSALTGLSHQTVTRLFEKEDGVILIERPESRFKRRYRTMRIPRAVYDRIIRKVTVCE